MTCLTSITERIYCAAWQPLTSANQESGSANPSEVTLAEGEAAPRRALWQRACSEALLQPGRGGAQEGQLGMQRRRRSCHRLCQLSHCQPHEEAEQSAAGPAIEGVWPWFGFRKGEGGKARLLRGMSSGFCIQPSWGAAPRRSPRVSARQTPRVPAFLTFTQPVPPLHPVSP